MEGSDEAVLVPKLCGWKVEHSAAVQNLFCFGYFVCVPTVDKTKKEKKKQNCVDKQTSLNNSGETFANQHTVEPVKRCRLFPPWTPAGTFLMLCWRCVHLSSE